MTAARAELEDDAATAGLDHRRASSALVTRRGRLDRLVEEGRENGSMLGKAAVEHRDAMVREETTRRNLAKAQRALHAAEAKQQKLAASVKEIEQRRAALEPQRRIREIDVAQDTIHTATKLTLSLLIAYALRVYLPLLAMSPATFASRIFSLRGRREVFATEEHIVFYENPRDPPSNQAVADACRRLNERKLQRSGRLLCYRTEEVDDDN